jgi:hypothetical protein
VEIKKSKKKVREKEKNVPLQELKKERRKEN